MANHQHYTECQDCGAGLIAQSVWRGMDAAERARQNERGFKRQGAGSRCVGCGDKQRRAAEREKRGPALPRASRSLLLQAYQLGVRDAQQVVAGEDTIEWARGASGSHATLQWLIGGMDDLVDDEGDIADRLKAGL